jgi:hypothetical protein
MPLALDRNALEDLGPAPASLDHLKVDLQTVAGLEARDAAQLTALDRIDDCAHGKK